MTGIALLHCITPSQKSVVFSLCVENDSISKFSFILEQDSENDHIYHSELFTMTKKMAKGVPQKISFTVPIFEPHPPQYFIRAVSDSWLHAEAFHSISFHNLTLPEVIYFLFTNVSLIIHRFNNQSSFFQTQMSHTELLDLKPLPISALGNEHYEGLYKFSHFNPIQTQVCNIVCRSVSTEKFVDSLFHWLFTLFY